MRYGSICSGIEAATVAWEPLGWEPAWFSEIEPFPCAVLQHHWPDVPSLGDITEGDFVERARAAGPVDIIVGGTPCFPAGTMVATDRGFVAIEEVGVGARVWTHQKRFCAVRRTGSKQADTVCVTGQGHHGMVTTPSHRFLSREKQSWSTRRGGRAVRLKDIGERRWVAARDLSGHHWACMAEWPEADIPPVDAMGREQRRVDPPEALMTLAGAYLVDGWTRINNRRGYVLLGLSPEKLARLSPMLDKVGAWNKQPMRTTVRVAISSRPIARWLAQHFGTGAAEKHVPMWVLGLPLQLRMALLQGYWITDGGDTATSGIRATTISKQLALTMRALAVSSGFASSVRFDQRPRTTMIEGRTVRQSDTYTVTFSPSQRSSFPMDGMRYQRVRNVEDTGRSERVYNLEVEGDHSYVADGLVVHNCQSFSVAGLRQGLDDPRGNLALVYLRIARDLQPSWLLWENVPGVLSVDGGRVFAAFLRGLAECGYGWAYRVLDSQHFGVPQRRRRVFVVGYLGDWRPAAAVLFERSCLQGDLTPRREAGQGVAASLTRGADSSGKGGYAGRRREDDVNLVCGTVRSHMRPGSNHVDAIASPVTASAGHHGHSSPRGDGQDPLVVSNSGSETWTEGSPRLGANPGCEPAAPCHTLHGSASDPPAVAFTLHGADKTKSTATETDVAGSIRTKPPGSVENSSTTVAMQEAQTGCREYATAGSLRAEGPGHDPVGTRVRSGMQVRGLTPTECARLQGFPDDHCRIPWRGKPAEECPDGPQYKAYGNSMAVPVISWIGERIAMVAALDPRSFH